jgi:hypothetical protein
MPHLEKVTQIKADYQLPEVKMRLTMKEKQAVTRQVRSRYLQAGRREKSAILDEFINITGYKKQKFHACTRLF